MVSDSALSQTASWPTAASQQLAVRCPHCKNQIAIERIPRAGLVRSVLFFLPLQAYKCHRCRRKFHRLKRAQKQSQGISVAE